MGEYSEVSRHAPCAICGKPDWCRRSGDGTAFCRRPALAGDSSPGKVIQDRNGAEILLVRPLNAPPPQRPPSYKRPQSVDWQRAAPDILHSVYLDLLNSLELNAVHHEALCARGLSAEEIEFRGYRTLPKFGRERWAPALAARHGERECCQVPGIYLDSKRRLRIAGAPGLLIPIRDPCGRVIALKVRADSPTGSNRYTSVSSKKHGGPGPGAPTHVPLRATGPTGTIRVTEGELKADIATALSGVLTLSVPGVSNWRAALPVIQAMKPTKVLVAFDSDWTTNLVVRQALRGFANTLAQNEELLVEIETWPTIHKGIDDALAGGAPVEAVALNDWKALEGLDCPPSLAKGAAQ